MKQQIVPIIIAAIAVVLQVVLAPIMPIMSVYPSFLVVLALVFSVLRNPDSTYIYAFVLGLLADLLSNTPIGLSSFLLVGIAFVLSRAFEVLDKSTAVMPLIAIVLSVLAYEVVLTIVLTLLGTGPFMDILIGRALPATIYNAVLGCIFYFILDRLSIRQDNHDAWAIPSAQRYR